MNNNSDSRIADLEAKFEALQALVSKEIAFSAEQRKESDDLRKQVTIFNTAFGLADADFKKIYEHANWLKERLEAAWKLLHIEDERIQYIEKKLGLQVGAINDLLRDKMRLDEVYYHVFPDRLSQDVRLLDQLGALAPKSAPDANPKKG